MHERTFCLRLRCKTQMYPPVLSFLLVHFRPLKNKPVGSLESSDTITLGTWPKYPWGTKKRTPTPSSFNHAYAVGTVLMTDAVLSLQIQNSPLTVSHFHYRVLCLTNIRTDLISIEQQQRRYCTEGALDGIIVCWSVINLSILMKYSLCLLDAVACVIFSEVSPILSRTKG